MNHIYKKVWNRVRYCFVAVSEAISSARQKTGKATVIVGAIGLTFYAGTGWAVMSTDYRENIPSGPLNNKVTAVEGEYRLNWASQVTVSNTGGLYTFIYGGRGMTSQLNNVTNSGQIYLGSWADGGKYYLNNAIVVNNAGAQFHIGNYAPKAINNGFNSKPLTEEQVQTSQPAGFELSGSGNIQNYGTIFNIIETKILGGSVLNNGTWQNDNVVNQTGGTVNGSGVLRTQGTYNLNAGTFHNSLSGDGTFNYNGGNFNALNVSGNVTVNIAAGLTASTGNFAGGKINNRGTLAINGGWFNTLNNWGTVNFSGDASFKNTVNYGNLNSLGTVIFNDNLRNSGNFNSHSGKWQFVNGGHVFLTSGTITTANHQNIFDSLGSSTQQALNYVSLNSVLPQEAKVSLNDFFLNYVPGNVAQSLIDHATFTGGRVVVTGVNLTTTQRDDLLQAFKAKFFLPDAFTSAVSQQC